MGSSSRDDTGAVSPTVWGDLPEADRALLLAMGAWTNRGPPREAGGEYPDHAGTHGSQSQPWKRLEPLWAGRLRDAWERESAAAGDREPDRALDQLRAMHCAEARGDLTRIHPSWWIRALKDESPAVQRVVAAATPQPLRFAVQAGLLLDSQDLISDRPAAPEVLGWVLSLWRERLVGGEPERPDDPPAIIWLSRLSLRAGYRLCRLAGLAKLVLADPKGGEGDHKIPPAQRSQWEWLRDHLTAADPELALLARHDVQTDAVAKLPGRRQAARIGLFTVARLLTNCEPFRVRWALQHWPYAIAKLIRSLMLPAGKWSSSLLRGESLVLKTAWDRLNLEGRLAMTWPAPLEIPGEPLEVRN
jgi:hypothetical protein